MLPPFIPSQAPRLVHPSLSLIALISGGQNGVDAASLRAGKRLGLSTGGWAPKDWITLYGPMPALGYLYGLCEHPSNGYPARTEANVRDSDATLRIASTFFSPGEKCTIKAIIKHKKAYLDIAVVNGSIEPGNAKRLIDFLVSNRVKVLNCAGNAETTSPGIDGIAERFLVETLSTVTL